MTIEDSDGLTITAAEAQVELRLSYPDGSRVHLILPKPAGFDGHSPEQAQSLVRRIGARLLSVALEDLRTPG